MKSRVITVTLNAAIDKTYPGCNLKLHSINRIQRVSAWAGGKGINVARVLRTLGVDVLAMGLIAGHNGEFIKEDLGRAGINADFITVPGESRLCLSYLGSGEPTEILEAGPDVKEQDFLRFEQELKQKSMDAHLVIISGSLPDGLRQDAYARLVKGCYPTRVIVDTSGEALRFALEAKPFLIKPNREELQYLTGMNVETEEGIEEAVNMLVPERRTNVLVSLGECGAWLRTGERTQRFQPYGVEVCSSIGCGDALVAGVACGLVRGLNLVQAIEIGMACAADNARHEQAGMVELIGINQLLGFAFLEAMPER